MIDISKIKVEDDRKLIKDAVDLCESGFFRASYLMAFLAGVESIRRIIKDYSSRFGGQYKSAWTTIEKKESSKLAPEDDIISLAEQCNIISSLDKMNMEHFLKMRNLYAHPYEMSPNSIDCQHIITTIYNSILSKEIYLHQEVISDYLKRYMEESALLSDDEDTIKAYIKNIVDRSGYHNLFFIFNTLSDSYCKFEPIDEISFRFDRVKYAIQFILESKTIDQIFAGHDVETFVLSHERVSIDFLSREDLFFSLMERIQDIIFNILEKNKAYQIIGKLVSNHAIRANLQNQARSIVEKLDAVFYYRYFPADYTIDKIISYLETSDFGSMNAAINIYNDRKSKFRQSIHDKTLDSDQLSKLGSAISHAYRYVNSGCSAIDVKKFVDNLKCDDHPKEIIDSFIVSFFIKDEEFFNEYIRERVMRIQQIFMTLIDKRQSNIKTQINNFISKYTLPFYFDIKKLNVLNDTVFSEFKDSLAKRPKENLF